MNGLTYLLENLKRKFDGKFIITRDVKYETIDRPSTIKKFELGALKIKKLLDDKVLEPPSSINIGEREIRKSTDKLLKRINNSFSAKGKFIHLIDKGEASCLALSLIATAKGIENILVVDERTTRMLGENPENLRKLLENKLHTKVQIKQNFDFLKNIRFIRSSELVYVAYKRNLVNLKDGNVLDALLYAVKYKGCAISRQEIEEAKKLRP